MSNTKCSTGHNREIKAWLERGAEVRAGLFSLALFTGSSFRLAHMAAFTERLFIAFFRAAVNPVYLHLCVGNYDWCRCFGLTLSLRSSLQTIVCLLQGDCCGVCKPLIYIFIAKYTLCSFEKTQLLMRNVWNVRKCHCTVCLYLKYKIIKDVLITGDLARLIQKVVIVEVAVLVEQRSRFRMKM